MIYVQPLQQKIVHVSRLYRPYQVWVLDQLDDELKFKKEEASSRNDQEALEFLKRLVAGGQIKPGGWVSLDRPLDAYEAVWPLAMQKLKDGKTLDLS